jgi:hypothetical protein
MKAAYHSLFFFSPLLYHDKEKEEENQPKPRGLAFLVSSSPLLCSVSESPAGLYCFQTLIA